MNAALGIPIGAAPNDGVTPLVTTYSCVSHSSGNPTQQQSAVVLRVAPWVGRGVQVTLGVGWDTAFDEGTGFDSSETKELAVEASAVTQTVVAYAGENDARGTFVGSLFEKQEEGAKPSRTTETKKSSFAVSPAPQTNGATAIVVVMDAMSNQYDEGIRDDMYGTVLGVINSVDSNELISLWGLSPNHSKPILISEFRTKRLGGRKHAARRLRDLLYDDAGLTQETLPINTSTTTTSILTSFSSLLNELSQWRDDPEGPAARDVVVVTREKFSFSDEKDFDSGRARLGGAWAMSWILRDTVGTRIDRRNGSLAIVTGWSSTQIQSRSEMVKKRRRQIIRVGVCGDQFNDAITFRVQSKQSDGSNDDSYSVTCSVPAPDHLPVQHLENNHCDPKSASNDDYPYPDAVTLRLTKKEKTVFDAKRSYYRGTYEQSVRAKEDMKLSVQFGDASLVDSEREGNNLSNGTVRNPPLPIKAKARFRGVSSLRDCKKRKSLRVNLNGKTKVRLAPGSSSDKFLLISMCYDDRYVKTKLVLELAKQLGVFPHTARYVRLLIENPLAVVGVDGKRNYENGGLYLLVDDPPSKLLRDNVRLGAVIRRRNDAKRETEPGKGTPDVKFPTSDDAFENRELEISTREKYDDVARVAQTCASTSDRLNTNTSPRKTCYEQLDEVIDLQQYLRWTSLMTLVGSGDHVDESWFYASDELGDRVFSHELPEVKELRHENNSSRTVGLFSTKPAKASWRFQMHAWDPDDAFQACHHGGRNALSDPYGLLVCAEGDVDKAFLGDARLYRAFVDTLEWTIRSAITVERVEQITRHMLVQLNTTLINDATAQGLTELIKANPDAVTKKESLKDIGESLFFYEWTLRNNRRTLLRKIATYRLDRLKGEGDAFDPIHAPSRAALDRESKDSPFKVDRKFKPIIFQSRRNKSVLSFESKVTEFRYDAERGVQELRVSGLTFTSIGGINASISLRGPTVALPVNQTVTYENNTYRAPVSEIRVSCVDSGLNNSDQVLLSSAIGVVDVFSESTNSCVLGNATVTNGDGAVLDVFDAYVYAVFNENEVSLRFTRDTGFISLPPDCSFSVPETSTISVYHRDWLLFPEGVLVEKK